VLLPAAVGLERLCWYASRAGLYPHLTSLEGAPTSLGPLFRSLHEWSLLGGAVAGLLAAALLPRLVLVAAVSVCVAGYALAGTAASFDDAVFGFRTVALGEGALRVLVYALIVMTLPTLRQRLLAIAISYLVVNVAALVASPLGVVLQGRFGGAWLLGAAVVIALAGALAIAVVAVDRLSPAPVEQPPEGDRGRAVLGAMAMVGVTLPLWMTTAAAAHRGFEALRSSDDIASQYGLIQTGGGVLAALAVAVLVALLAGRAAAPPLSRLLGWLLAVGAAGSLLATLPGIAGLVLSSAVFAVAELAAPLSLGRAVTSQAPRVVTAVAASVSLIASAGSMVARLDGAGNVVLLLVGTAALCGLGALLIRRGDALDAWLDQPMVSSRRGSWLSDHKDTTAEP
jgi:MFS family permease